MASLHLYSVIVYVACLTMILVASMKSTTRYELLRKTKTSLNNMSGDTEAAMRSDKRASLSVTQDLMSIADMLHDEAYRRRLHNAQSFLDALGKRRSSGVVSYNTRNKHS